MSLSRYRKDESHKDIKKLGTELISVKIRESSVEIVHLK